MLRCPNWLIMWLGFHSYHIGKTSFSINSMVNAWKYPIINGSLTNFHSLVDYSKGISVALDRKRNVSCWIYLDNIPQYFICSCKMWFLHQYHEFVFHLNSWILGFCEICVFILTDYSFPCGHALIQTSYF